MSQNPRRKLGVYSLGFLRNPSLRAALAHAGWEVVPGLFRRDLDAIGIWGGRPVARRGVEAAKRRGLPLVHIEDAPLRSVRPGNLEPVMGLTVDEVGNYLDFSRPSALENLLNGGADVAPHIDAVLEAFLRSGLSKYNDAYRPACELPDMGFVLVVDQLRDDASIRLGGADAFSFARMLEAAMDENPGVPVYVKRHPRAHTPERGHFYDLPEGVQFLPDGFVIADVLDRAGAVYCVTSQVGFEAILRGISPRVFGGAFYAGWGLSWDEQAIPRRSARLSESALFERVMIDYPTWFDVYSGGRTDFVTAMRGLEARRRSHDVRRGGAVAVGMRLWKRSFVRDLLGNTKFCNDPTRAIELARRDDRNLIVWASSKLAGQLDAPVSRLEDGFLRSVGLGAELVEPMSACLDDLGIYYDPTRENRLEVLIKASRDLTDGQLARAEALRISLTALGLSKYNVGQGSVKVPSGRRVILVPGQVEDDASILLGTAQISTNLELLKVVRAEHPDGYILYKPHPDVEAGLRPGAVSDADLGALADQVVRGVSAEAALKGADEVWTMTSLMGFEALLRSKTVITFGQPFYAGWGLTEDRGGVFERRGKGIRLDGLVHAALIDYPIYRDPISGFACPVEVVVERLASGQGVRKPRLLSKLQGVFASQSWLWR